MTAVDPQALSVLEALHTTPARRYLSTEPISDEIIRELIDAAVRGPSGGNSQLWAWIVVRDQEVKDQIAAWYKEGWDKNYGSRRDQIVNADGGMGAASFRAGDHLANHLAEAPVWVFPVLLGPAKSANPRLGASIYGAVQQLMLAARAYGIGTTLTTLYTEHEAGVRELLGLPDNAITMALIPLGYPARGKWAQPKRKPVDEVLFFDKYQA